MQDAEIAQKEHYEQIGALHDAHYGDEWSQRYRDRFLDAPLLAGLDLRGKAVLEAMCGSGMTTGALLARGAVVTGLDIADMHIATFRRRWPQCDAVHASILDSGLPSGRFDAVVVVGALHHVHPHLEAAVAEIHRLLVPGGWFCFMEPHARCVTDWFRRAWYRLDRRFMSNEAAIDIDALHARFADRFDRVHERYGGNLAFLLVWNSLVFHIPLGLKRLYSPLLLRLEGWIGARQPRALACFAICQWRKR